MPGAAICISTPDEDVRTLQLQQLAIEIVGKPHVSGMIDQLAQNRIRRNRIGPSVIFTEDEARIRCGHPIDGFDIPLNLVPGKSALQNQHPVFHEFFPLLNSKASRRYAIPILVHESLPLYT